MQLLRRIGAFKTLIQCVIGCMISSVLIGLSQSSITIKVGGAFELNDGSGKTRSSFGVAGQIDGMKCDMRVVNPFEITPVTLPGNYLCRWVDGESLGNDALCFDPFECTSLHNLWELYLITGCIYLVSYFVYGGIWTAVRFRLISRKKYAEMFYSGIIIMMLGNFVFNKVLDKYLMGVFMDDFSEKIRSIVSNNGYPGFSFVGAPVYELQGTKKVSQSLFDICSGMIVGLVVSAIDNIRGMTPHRTKIHNIELTERLT